MPFAEYEEMRKIIDLQDEAIKHLSSCDNIVVIDKRNIYLGQFHNTIEVPYVWSDFEKFESSMLREIDYLERNYSHLQDEAFFSIRHGKHLKKRFNPDDVMEKPRKKWWKS